MEVKNMSCVDGYKQYFILGKIEILDLVSWVSWFPRSLRIQDFVKEKSGVSILLGTESDSGKISPRIKVMLL